MTLSRLHVPKFKKTFDRNASSHRPVDLHIRLNMRLCEGLETVKLVDGALSIMGKIGHYDMRFETAITDDTKDALYLYWRKKPLGKPAPHTLGQLVIKLKDQTFDAQHPQTGETLKGTLGFLFNTQITSK